MKMTGRFAEERLKIEAAPAGAARGETLPASRWRVADLVLDTRRQRVWRGGQEIPLPKLTYDLFATLVRRSPDVIPDEELMKAVWPGLIVSPETVSQRVKLLRAALGDESRTPRYVGRLRGRGYHLVPAAYPVGSGEAVEPADAATGAADLELSLVESPDDPDLPAAPDWAVTQVLPLDVAVAPMPDPVGFKGAAAPADAPAVADAPAAAGAAARPTSEPGPPAEGYGNIPVWVSWALICAALVVTGMVVVVLRAS